MHVLGSIVLAAALIAPAPTRQVHATPTLETFEGITKEQRRGSLEIAASLEYAELAWVLDTAKQRLADLPTAFDAAAIEQAIRERFPDATDEQTLKIHAILLQILMGDIAGALRSYAVLMDRDMRRFTREILDKLDAVRKARSTVIRNFARTKPPRAYAGTNPSTAARAQDKSSVYNRYVKLTIEITEESERLAVDALHTGARELATVWAALHPADDDD